MLIIKYTVVIGIRRIFVGNCNHTTKVTRIRGGWNCRVYLDGIVNQELRVYNKENIRLAFADMLRMEDKCGNISSMASGSRVRNYKTK